MSHRVLDGAPAPVASPIQPCWVEVDLERIRRNVAVLRALLPSRTELAAVVKADAYGLGAAEVARAALEGGASRLAVARVDEGVRLRRGGIGAPILNLAYTGPDEARTLVEYRLTPTIADLQTARAVAAVVPSGAVIDVHLKVDTGLSRYGAQLEELPALLAGLERLPGLRIQGLSSHFASADEADLAFARHQLRQFCEAEQILRDHGIRPELRHIANSAGTLALPEARLDMVRAGITLSGHYPSADVPRLAGLEPAVRLKARVARVYDLPAGSSVGYNRTFVAARPTRAALIAAGYADGLPRALSNRGAVLIRGHRAPLVGRVSMDQSVADVTDVPGARPGDEVVLVGAQGQERISLDEFAGWADTIGHEALCRIGPRVPRYYRLPAAMTRPAWPAQARAAGGNGSAVEVFTHTTRAHP